MRGTRIRRLGVLVVPAALLLAACSSAAGIEGPTEAPSASASPTASAPPTASPSGSVASSSAASTTAPASSTASVPPAAGMAAMPIPVVAPGPFTKAEYLPGLAAVVRVPPTAAPAPLVVVIPGGGWKGVNESDVDPLAAVLTDWGYTTSVVWYDTVATGGFFPLPVDEVACAVRWSAQVATASGRAPSSVVVIGHSAGTHLGSLAALAPGQFGGSCPYPAVHVDAFVGLAGFYDPSQPVAAFDEFMQVPAAQDPARWRDASPLAWVGRQGADRDVRFLLLHGASDDIIPVGQTHAFASALSAAGYDVRSVDMPGGHMDLLEPGVIVPAIHAWLSPPAVQPS